MPGALLVGKQTTLDSVASSFDYVPGVRSFDIRLEKEPLIGRVVAKRWGEVAVEAPSRVTGDIEVFPSKDNLNLLLPYVMLKDGVSVDLDGVPHLKWTPAENPAVWATLVYKKLVWRRALNVLVNEAEFTFEAGELPTLRLGIIGSSEEETTAPSYTVSEPGNVISPLHLKVKVGGTEYKARRLTLTIRNNIVDDYFYLSRDSLDTSLAEALEIEGEFETRETNPFNALGSTSPMQIVVADADSEADSSFWLQTSIVLTSVEAPVEEASVTWVRVRFRGLLDPASTEPLVIYTAQ